MQANIDISSREKEDQIKPQMQMNEIISDMKCTVPLSLPQDYKKTKHCCYN